MLDITRLEQQTLKFQLEKMCLHQTVEQTIEMVAAQALAREVEIVNEIPELTIETDHNLLGRVLLNLLNNAVKYTRKESKIRITGGMNSQAVNICVDDFGPGIPEEFHTRIFEMYGSADIRQEARGAGIGLAFCKMAVEALGGTISVQNLPERGSRFSIGLPTTPKSS